jgi:hypothetical protein
MSLELTTWQWRGLFDELVDHGGDWSQVLVPWVEKTETARRRAP